MSLDGKLEELRRQLAADPTDSELRSRYIGELIRLGKGEQARSLVLDRFLCSKTWEDFVDIGESDVSFYKGCMQRVYWAYSAEEIATHSRMGRCVVAAMDEALDFVDDQVDRFRGDQEPGSEPPCLVDAAPRQGSLCSEEVGAKIPRDEFWRSLALSHECLPLREDGELTLVFAEEPEEATITALSGILRPVGEPLIRLVTRFELRRAIKQHFPEVPESDFSSAASIWTESESPLDEAGGDPRNPESDVGGILQGCEPRCGSPRRPHPRRSGRARRKSTRVRLA